RCWRCATMSGRRRRASTRCSTRKRWGSAMPTSGAGPGEMGRRPPPPSPGRDGPWSGPRTRGAGAGRERREAVPRPRRDGGGRGATMGGRRRRASTRCATRKRWGSALPTSGAGPGEMGRRPPPPSPGRDGPWSGPRTRGAGAGRERREAVPRPRRDGGGRGEEVRLHGLNAVQAVFARRPQAIRKLYLAPDRIPTLQPLLKWCVAHRIGYRVVEDVEELRRLSASTHHEGVVVDVLREPPLALEQWLSALPDGPCCALWLDGVGN